MLHKNVKSTDWIELKYKGKTHLVAVSNLLDAHIGRHRNCCPECKSPDPDEVHSTACSIGGAASHG